MSTESPQSWAISRDRRKLPLLHVRKMSCEDGRINDTSKGSAQDLRMDDRLMKDGYKIGKNYFWLEMTPFEWTFHTAAFLVL